MTALLVALGAAVGSPLRYLADRFIQARHDSLFPWGTWTVNVAGSFLLGLLAAGAVALPVPVMAGLSAGVCGALTTYSTFAYETVRLLEEGSYLYAGLNAAANILAGLAAAWAGTALAGVG